MPRQSKYQPTIKEAVKNALDAIADWNAARDGRADMWSLKECYGRVHAARAAVHAAICRSVKKGKRPKLLTTNSIYDVIEAAQRRMNELNIPADKRRGT